MFAYTRLGSKRHILNLKEVNPYLLVEIFFCTLNDKGASEPTIEVVQLHDQVITFKKQLLPCHSFEYLWDQYTKFLLLYKGYSENLRPLDCIIKRASKKKYGSILK